MDQNGQNVEHGMFVQQKSAKWGKTWPSNWIRKLAALGDVTKDSLSSEETQWSGVAYRNPNSWGLNPSKWGVKLITMAMWTTCRVSLLVFFFVRKTMWCVCLKILYANGLAYHHFFSDSSGARFFGEFRHCPIFGLTNISLSYWKSKWPESLWTSQTSKKKLLAWNQKFLRGVRVGLASNVTFKPSIFWMLLRKNEHWYTVDAQSHDTRMHKEHEVKTQQLYK